MIETIDTRYSLEDCFTRDSGRFYVTGSQALVLLSLLQARLDRAAGLNTAGFISGYRGSPLGGFDQALWRAGPHLEHHAIRFVPALNEELGATAVAGSQQVEAEGTAANRDGVFGLFYAKGPGIDRAGDALKHGHANGSSPHGGVLVVAGDDHGCISSSMSHQSEQAMQAWRMPVLNPADLRDYIEFGLYGWALSRFSGAWVGFKAISETVESAAVITVPAALPRFAAPVTYDSPGDGLYYRWPNLPSTDIERRMCERLEAARAFAAANSIDRLLAAADAATLGIVTAGKAHLDLMQALDDMGLGLTDLDALGIRLYKVGLTYPLESERLLAFAAGLDEILVVEEKGPVVEQQLKTLLFDRCQTATRVLGKRDEQGRPLIPEVDETRPHSLRDVLQRWLARTRPALGAHIQSASQRSTGNAAATGEPPCLAQDAAGSIGKRLPYFCPGCPHNTSTRVPEGSRAYGGIGCHYMATWMDRNTQGLVQMGGEGANWIGLAPFTETGHVFQNLGDGTLNHSGSLAIRAAVAAGVNITYKILVNDAVAMTGGQPLEGSPEVDAICRGLAAEGVKSIVVVSDDPGQFERSRFPRSVRFNPRERLDTVQEELRRTPGVSALLYVQTCAAEKRRRRKRGRFPDPPRRLLINEQVCEDCGDCSKVSNCIALTPVETQWGRKRRIDQTACNKDYLCNDGFCPSFVTVVGGELRRRSRVDDAALAELVRQLPEPATALDERAYNLLVTGVGGTGIVTVGAIICVAAHLEGKAASVLDFMGFAQKGGAVISHVRLARESARLRQVRIDQGQADALLACDLVVANQPEPLATLQPSTRVVASLDVMPTAELVLKPDKDLNATLMLQRLRARVGRERIDTAAFRYWAEELTGGNSGANIMQLGYAWQRGLVPVSRTALERAIELNAVAVAANLQMFALGRVLAEQPEMLAGWLGRGAPAKDNGASEDLETLVARCAAYLADYQNTAYAERYRQFVRQVAEMVTQRRVAGAALVRAVARNLFKLMAYKDEYEVARLHSDPKFLATIAGRFEGELKLEFNLAPPLLARKDPATGRPLKRRFGAWLLPVLRGLAALKRLRGTPFDPFGYTAERRMERRLIERYRATISDLLPRLDAVNLALALEIAELPAAIRGYGQVKQRAVAAFDEREAELLRRYAATRALARAA